MKFHINRLELLRVISVINCGVETASTSPVQGLASIEVKGQTATFTAINMDMGVTEKVEADVEIEGGVVVDIKKISEWASRCKDEDVLFKKNSSTLSLKSGKSSFNLKLKDVTLPEFPVWSKTFSISGVSLCSVIDDVISASEDNSNSNRTYTNGIHISIKAETISATATQGNLLLYSEKPALNTTQIETVIPRKVAQDIMKLVRLLDVVHIEKTSNVTFFCIGSTTTLFYRNTDSKLPSWRAMLPKERGTTIEVVSEELISCLSRTAVSLDGDLKVAVEVTPDSISVASAGNVGDNQESISAVSNNSVQFNINWRFLSEALKGTDNAEIVYSGDRKPLIVYRSGTTEYIALLALMV